MQKIHGGDIYRNQVNIDFSVNINPLGMPKEVETALQKAVKKCHEYPDIMAEKLTKAVSNRLSIPQEYLAFGNGASEIFMGLVHAVKPKKIMIPIPSFYGYEYAAKATGSNIIYFPLKADKEFLPDQDFLDALTADIELLFLANPNNPTGKLPGREYLESLLKICKEKNIYVVLDECFIEFCEHAFSMLSKIKEYDNLLLVRAFTKIYAIPGVRLGYLVCSNSAILKRVRKQLPEWNLSTFAQEAGIACMNQYGFIEETVEYVKRERQFLIERLKEIGLYVFSSDANFILIYSQMPLYEKLLQQGILIRNCENYRGLAKGYYRIAVKQRAKNEILWKAIGECIE